MDCFFLRFERERERERERKQKKRKIIGKPKLQKENGAHARGKGMAPSPSIEPIVDQPLSSGKNEVSLSAFAFLFSEIVQYHLQRVSDTNELELKLEEAGAHVGRRVLELIAYREKPTRRETRLNGILTFIQNNVWKNLFGRAADSLEIYNDDEYMISDRDVLVNRFISVPKDYQGMNCASFVAGVVKGCLESAGFDAQVSAYDAPTADDGHYSVTRTNFLVKVDATVLEREQSF